MAVRPNILSICTGAGGLDLGIRLACPAARTVCYVEREAFAVANLVAAIQAGLMDDAPLWSDLVTFDGRPWRGVVDWLIGGIPCQPHSSAGQKRGADDERDLWPDTARVIREIRPGIVFLENVPGIARYYHERIGPELRAMGYGTQEGLFSAAEVGAPHERHRFFVLGYADSQGREGQGSRADGTCGCWPSFGATGSCLANAEKYRCKWSRRTWTGRTRLENACLQIPDSCGQRLQGLGWAREEGGEQGLESLFPPGPNDLQAWASLLAEVPEVEPSFCRDADGVARWLDATTARSQRLQVLGNGVVPLVAAHALCTLAARAGTVI